MSLIRPTALASQLIAGVVREGATVVDATCGNGKDTTFLAQLVGPSGRVHAFDIQAAAISRATSLLASEQLDARVTFHLASHAEIADRLKPGVKGLRAAMFNLGYLPGEDHAVTSEASSTLTALGAVSEMLEFGGLITVVCYPGHAQGALEAAAVEAEAARLGSGGWRTAIYRIGGTRSPAPFLIALEKCGAAG